jgi:DNA-binding transcriptional LysR family regulator
MHCAHARPLNLRALDVRLLLVFEALLHEDSVSRAAARVALSQPAMSRTLARLRRVFGDPLFRRDSGRLLPTGRALELAPAVAATLDGLLWSKRLEDRPLHAWLRSLLRQLTLELPAASGSETLRPRLRQRR